MSFHPFNTVSLAVVILCLTAQVSGQQQQQQQQRQRQQENPPPVPTLTRESFESLPRPGRYFLQINYEGKKCDDDGACPFDEIWDELSKNLANNAHYAGNMFRIACTKDPTFCEDLEGPVRYANERHKNSETSLLAVEFPAHQTNDPSSQFVRMEPFNRDMQPELVVNWLGEFVNKQLTLPRISNGDFENNWIPLDTENPRIALLMLSRDGLGPRPDVWCEFLTLAVEQGVRVRLVVHDMMIAKRLNEGGVFCTAPEHEAANKNIVPINPGLLLFTAWRSPSLVRAIVLMMSVVQVALGGADWYAIVSDNSVPLVDPLTMAERLAGPGFVSPSQPERSTFSVFQAMPPGRPAVGEIMSRFQSIRPPYKLPPGPNQAPLPTPSPPSLTWSDFAVAEMWAILDHAAATWFVGHHHQYEPHFEMVAPSDETYFLSLSRWAGLPVRLANRHDTLPSESSVPAAEDNYMYVEWSTDLRAVRPETLAEINPEAIARWSRGGKQRFLFARKVSNETKIDLPWLETNRGMHEEL